MSEIIKATAKVKVLLEIEVSDIWENDCPLDQVFKQAKESALNIITKQMIDRRNITIVGEPEVIAVLAERRN